MDQVHGLAKQSNAMERNAMRQVHGLADAFGLFAVAAEAGRETRCAGGGAGVECFAAPAACIARALAVDARLAKMALSLLKRRDEWEASRARVVRTCSEGSAFGVGGGNSRGGMTADAMKDAHYAIAPSTVFAKGQQARALRRARDGPHPTGYSEFVDYCEGSRS